MTYINSSSYLYLNKVSIKVSITPHLDIKNVVSYILHYAEDHTVLLPGRIPGYKRDDLQFLPSSTRKRVTALPQYSIGRRRHEGSWLFPFMHSWKELTPQVVVPRPMSDLCLVCQKNSKMIVWAHNRLVAEKSEVNLL